ncbi:MAG: signal peptidase II [Firmicutes bacterium]|nr:signal peptidase II [Bacillota bacterium]
MKKNRYLWVVGIILLDQIVKLVVRSTMYVGQSIPVINDIFHFTYVQNRGAAFNMLDGKSVILIAIPTIAIAVAIWYMEKHLEEHWTLFVSLVLVIAGGIGNLIDRCFMGFVTDMFDFRFWPVFNVADIAVCVGAGILVLYTFAFYEEKEKKDNEV